MSDLRGIFSNTTTDAAHSLTLDDLLRTAEALRRPPRPHYHVISSRAKPGSVTYCADCKAPVRVPENWRAR